MPTQKYEIDQARQREAQLGALYAIAQALSTQADQRQMLTKVLHILDERLAMYRGTVTLRSFEGSELVVEAARDADPVYRDGVRYHKGEGILGHVLDTGEPAVIPHISEEPRFQGRIHQRSGADHDLAFICVPIALGNEVVGTLSADLPAGSDSHLCDAQRFLSIVAALISNDVKARRTAKLARQALEQENLELRSALGEQFRPENLVGNSDAMKTVYQRIHQVAQGGTTVLIRGESGTGKEMVAAAVHYSSQRADRPFVRVNCAALSEALVESELFGHERGAFTGAVYARTGRVEEAHEGTLFLDEIGDFSLAVQVKLLRVLQEKEFERVGGNRTHRVDIRVIAATNRDLEAAVREGAFRQDLYYRINVFPLYLPPLRERRNDILLLIDHFVEKYSQSMTKDVSRVSTQAINMMMAYHWPGNVRELENCIEHAIVLSQDGVIHAHHLPPTLQMPAAFEPRKAGSLKAATQLLEKDLVIDALKRNEGNVAAASRELGITARMVRYKIQKLGIEYLKYFRRG